MAKLKGKAYKQQLEEVEVALEAAQAAQEKFWEKVGILETELSNLLGQEVEIDDTNELQNHDVESIIAFVTDGE